MRLLFKDIYIFLPTLTLNAQIEQFPPILVSKTNIDDFILAAMTLALGSIRVTLINYGA